MPVRVRNALRRRYLTNGSSSQVVLGIRREDPSRIWERRAPLSPDLVRDLVRRQKGRLKVVVESCTRRCWGDDEYEQAGAQIVKSLNDPDTMKAHITIGIKEPQLNEFSPDALVGIPNTQSDEKVPRTHLMFSHTTKGQPYNMPLLAKFLSSRSSSSPSISVEGSGLSLPRLIDYELLTSTHGGQRTVGFGYFAGLAGTLESLSALGHHHLNKGVYSPFLQTPRPHLAPSLSTLRDILRSVVGKAIKEEGTPKALGGGVVVGVTGNGKVTQGMLSMLQELPHEFVGSNELPQAAGPSADRHKIYIHHSHPSDYLSRADGGSYNREEYYSDPSQYISLYGRKIAPFTSLVLNGVGWQPGFPRLMSNEDLKVSLKIARRSSLKNGMRAEVWGDISCDVEGGIQFLPQSTTLSSPTISFKPSFLPADSPGITMMAVDILPTSLPKDASTAFGEKLMPYLDHLVEEYHAAIGGVEIDSENAARREAKEIKDALDRATVAREGKLVSKWGWLKGELEKVGVAGVQIESGDVGSSSSEPLGSGQQSQGRLIAGGKATGSGAGKKKRVLLLGSGMVAKPVVDAILAKSGDVAMMIGSALLTEAKTLAQGYDDRVETFEVNVEEGPNPVSERLSEAVKSSDLVISLLPATLHPKIAESCITHGVHLITPSYVSPEMSALHSVAQQKGILLLNELGLDPGIDHCSAASLVHSLRSEGKEVQSFVSVCGGLPAPDVEEMGPLSYKFSWSPRGVMLAARNAARFRVAGKQVDISGERLLKTVFGPLTMLDVGDKELECIANRDSLPYAEEYKLGEKLRTVMRGTLRYSGFSEIMDQFKALGLLDVDKPRKLETWDVLLDEERLLSVLSTASREQETRLIDALAYLGFQSSTVGLDGRRDDSRLPPLPRGAASNLDLFAMLLASKLAYGKGERDMVVLHHELIASSPPFGGEEKHTSSLTAYGDEQYSAMAKTVGLPVAIAALGVLEGRIGGQGVMRPMEEEVWRVVLGDLEEYGIGIMEKSTMLKGGRSIEKVVEEGCVGLV